ncbi:MAG TPA: osmoprotectant NAGGN system M42 family peptidase [Gammaproteobacteria bacterium]|nr:osmoprotectant NAGGN system M42 family peptidase [Gammaproteobacteria bacterium]
MKLPVLDGAYARHLLLEMLDIPSPTGFTDEIVHYTGRRLEELGIPFEVTRRGAIRANITGKQERPDRAVVTHLDTIGCMVKWLKPNGRLEVVPVGTWSARFAEGARVTIFTDNRRYRGTILPLKASGHTYGDAVDKLPIKWSNVEVRIDEPSESRADLERLGINVGDYVAVDPQPEIDSAGYINARHLDDKAGVAVVLAVAKALRDCDATLPLTTHLLFTVSEEVGSGASHVLHQDVAEMVTIDTATLAPEQNSSERGVTIAMMDSSGPFDFHLTHKLLRLCEQFHIYHTRDVFRFYHSDSASAIDAGNDIRTALVCFGTDATHGWERCHLQSLESLGKLLLAYLLSPPTFQRDREELAPLAGFPKQQKGLENGSS